MCVDAVQFAEPALSALIEFGRLLAIGGRGFQGRITRWRASPRRTGPAPLRARPALGGATARSCRGLVDEGVCIQPGPWRGSSAPHHDVCSAASTGPLWGPPARWDFLPPGRSQADALMMSNCRPAALLSGVSGVFAHRRGWAERAHRARGRPGWGRSEGLSHDAGSSYRDGADSIRGG